MITVLRGALDWLLQAVCALLMVGLSVMVLAAVALRAAGNSPLWYDEIAAIWLVWLTFAAASLVTLRRAHLGFDGLVRISPPAWRRVFFFVGETVSLVFYAAIAIYGWRVLDIIGDEALVSLPWLEYRTVQAIIPVAGVVMFLAQVCSAPEIWQRMEKGVQAK